MNRGVGHLFLFFHYLILLFSYITPRRKNIWCFGSNFSGNAKYLFIYASINNSQRCIWIGEKQDVDYVKKLGFEAYTNNSFKGLFFLLTSGVYIYNSYVGNVCYYTWGRVKKVNLWHGVGLKNIEYNIKIGPIAERYHAKGLINALRYMNFRVKPDVLLTTSPMMTRHFVDCFQVNDKVIIEGIYPRCELLVGEKSQAKEFIIKYEGEDCKKLVEQIEKFTYTYIYMPTFRDDGKNFINDMKLDFDLLNEILRQKNRLLVLKLHPDTKIELKDNYSNIIVMGNSYDLYPVLPFTDCLITDYSSIYFDYILMRDKKIILFIPDYEDYISKSRDLAFSYDEYTKGIIATNFGELISLFEKDTKDYSMPDLELIRNSFWNPMYSTMDALVTGIKEKISE